MIRAIFKNQSLQSQFREEGYAIVPLLSEEELEGLKKIYIAQEKEAQVDLRFYTSIWSENPGYRESVDTEIKKILAAALNKYFIDCKPVFANFMVKQPGENSHLIPHQDWSFVDETKYDSVTAWCPLIDVTPANGNLQVVPRSHRLNNLIRGRFFDAPFGNLPSEDISPLLLDLPMKAGESLILNSRIIHASPPNLSSSVRVAASVVMAPKEAELLHYVLEDINEKKTFKKLHIIPNFFTNYSCYDPLTNLKSDEKFPYQVREMNKEELLSIISN